MSQGLFFFLPFADCETSRDSAYDVKLAEHLTAAYASSRKKWLYIYIGWPTSYTNMHPFVIYIYIYICVCVCVCVRVCVCVCGPGSSVGIATDYGLDGSGSNPGRDEIFRPSRPALGPTQPPVQWVPGLSRGWSAAGACCWPLTPF